MRISAIVLALSLAMPAAASRLADSEVARRIRVGASGTFSVTNMPAASRRGAAEAALDYARESLQHAGALPGELRIARTRRSLSGTHVQLSQFIGDLEVVNGDVNVTIDDDHSVSIHGRAVRALGARSARSQSFRRGGGREVLFLRDGVAIRATEVLIDAVPLRPCRRYVAEDGSILAEWPLYYGSDTPARIFTSNPVTRLNDSSLRDHDDSSAAVPRQAYDDVALRDTAAVPLAGPHVTIVDVDSPATAPSSVRASDRSDDRFEEEMAYFHVDSSQRYLQSLGYRGDLKIIDHPLEVDAHALNGEDGSRYVAVPPGRGRLFYGDGGVDDAEDPDVIIHEYAHAIHDAVAPGVLGGSPAGQARALSEAFADYWAFSYGYQTSVAYGRDPFCIGDWDVRCGGAPSARCAHSDGADCLRRVDGRTTMADYVDRDQAGVEHLNSAIWSSAMREIFLAVTNRDGVEEGKRKVDTLAIESLFGLPTAPGFEAMALRLLAADRILHQSANASVICQAMSTRAIVAPSQCALSAAGARVIFTSGVVQASIPDAGATGVSIPIVVADPRLIENLSVSVDIEHSHRADLRIVLRGPHGESVVLQEPSLSDAGSDLHVTYGLDAAPRESLDLFRGRAANGTWKLEVTDISGEDIGAVISWSLAFVFQNATPLRWPDVVALPKRLFPAAAEPSYAIDLAITNPTSNAIPVILVKPPMEESESFRAVRLELPAGGTTFLSDVETSLGGSITNRFELRGEVASIGVSARARHRLEKHSGHSLREITAGAIARPNGVPVRLSLPTRTMRLQVASTSEQTARGRARFFSEEGRLIADVSFEESTLEVPASARSAEIFVERGEAAAHAVVTSDSGDRMLVPGRVEGRAHTLLPVFGRVIGVSGDRWMSALAFSNFSNAPVDVRLVLSSGFEESRVVTLEPHRTVVFSDAVPQIFGRTHGAGFLRIEHPREVTAASWIEHVSDDAVRIEEVPFTSVEPANVTTIPLLSGRAQRTNVSVANVTSSATTALLRWIDRDGVRVAMHEVTIPPRAAFVISPRALGLDLANSARLSVRATGGVVVAASEIDEESGDFFYTPATAYPGE